MTFPCAFIFSYRPNDSKDGQTSHGPRLSKDERGHHGRLGRSPHVPTHVFVLASL